MDTVRRMTLKDEISKLSNQFAQGILQAIRTSSLDEILEKDAAAPAKSVRAPRAATSKASVSAPAPAKARRGGGRLHRRSEEELGAIGDKVIELLKAHAEGLRAEQIRVAIGIDAKELPRPLKDLLASKKIKAKGQKRATTYFAK